MSSATASDSSVVSPARPYLDQLSPQVYKAQVQVAKAVRAASREAGLDRILVELINVRVSQINGCAYCLDTHVRDALLAGETSQRLAVLPGWRDTDLFSETERAALQVAEAVTSLGSAEDRDRAVAQARAQLSDEQFSVISWIAITMNAFNRLSIMSRHPVRPRDGSVQ